MKNFPEHDQFDELEKRLRNYTDEPDELVWENIDAALRPNRTLTWLPWVDHFASTIVILVGALSVGTVEMNQTLPSARMITNKSVIPHPEENTANSNLAKSPLSGVVQTGEEFSRKDNVVSNDDVKGIAKIVFETDTSVSVSLPAEPSLVLKGNLPDTGTLPVLVIPTDSLAQNDKSVSESKRIPKRRPAFYANLTPSLSFQHVIPVGSDEIVIQKFSDVSILSAERFGISLDAGVQGFISKRFEYYAGLSVYHQNQTLKYTYQTGFQANVESSGDNNSYIVTPTSTEGQVNYKMLNLGIQAGVLYNLYGKTLTHKIGAGLGYQQGFRKGDSGSYENSESSYFSYQVFYRNDVRVSSRLCVFVQPMFAQSIRVREELNVPFNLKPYRAGIGFGILYDF